MFYKNSRIRHPLERWPFHSVSVLCTSLARVENGSVLCTSQARVDNGSVLCASQARVENGSVLCARESVAPRCMPTVPSASHDLL